MGSETTRDEIKRWLAAGNNAHTHMVVVCDEFSWEDFPVYVNTGQDVKEVVDKHNGEKLQRVMEVYSFSQDLEKQLDESRAYHLD